MSRGQSLMIWGGIFLALLVVVSVFGSAPSAGEAPLFPSSARRSPTAPCATSDCARAHHRTLTDGKQFSTVPVDGDTTLTALLDRSASPIPARPRGIVRSSPMSSSSRCRSFSFSASLLPLRQVQKGGGAGARWASASPMPSC